ncbi:regenerating islet-derived protein 4 [Apteryx mantelli]|uniref:Regenerating islet-derived protein 4 n=1 Tax=Apteryx mantelli TaxID=2696672 RepID=A0ABM4EV08_9AVES
MPLPESQAKLLFLPISVRQGTLRRRMAAAARLALLLLLLLGCVDLLQGSRVRYLLHCPPGWSYYKLSCFKYFRQLRSWDEAEAQCQASHPGAHLAWVEEPREAATLGKAISYHQRTQPVWIGLRSPRQGQAWSWANGADYSKASGLPGSGAHGGACAVLPHLGGFTRWSGADCAQRHHFLCKFAPAP